MSINLKRRINLKFSKMISRTNALIAQVKICSTIKYAAKTMKFPKFEDLKDVVKNKTKKMPKFKPPERTKRIKKECSLDDTSSLRILGNGIDDTQDYILECHDNEDFQWVKEEAAVDSGAVDCVANRDRFPHLEVFDTPESLRGEHWTSAGGNHIKKEGEVRVNWFTDDGQEQTTNIWWEKSVALSSAPISFWRKATRSSYRRIVHASLPKLAR